MDLRQQQRNLNSYLNTMPYERRHEINDHLIKFIKDNEGFWIRSGTERNNANIFFSFIEVVGFIIVGKNMIEVRVMIPHNYPNAPPQFDLVYHSDSYEIASQNALLAMQIISLRKNLANEELIRLNFEEIRNLWMNPNNRHVCLAYRQVQRLVNSPPLLFLRNRDNPMINTSMKNIGLNRGKSTGLTQLIFSELQTEIIVLQDKQSKVEMAKQESDYKEARVDFFSRNIPKLGEVMKNQEIKVRKELDIVRKKQEEVVVKNSMNPLLVVSSKDEKKIEVMARHEAMREGERHMVSCLQKNLRELNVSFQEHKNLIRQFYEKMFESQLQYLKICQ